MSDKPAFYDAVQPVITAFAIGLQERHGLRADGIYVREGSAKR